MNSLEYKEIRILYKQKKKLMSVLATVGILIAVLLYNGVNSSFFIFNVPFLASMVFIIEMLDALIMVEKKNKTLEKMLSIFRIEKIVKTKVFVIAKISYAIGIVFSILMKIIFIIRDEYTLSFKIMITEWVVLGAFVIVVASTFALIYLLFNSQGIISIFRISILIGVTMFSLYLQAGEIGLRYILLIVIAAYVIYRIEIEILKKVKMDYLTRD